MLPKLQNPIIAGTTANFLWKGKSASRFISDIHQWEQAPQRMKRAGKDLWEFSIKLSPKAYLEYALSRVRTSGTSFTFSGIVNLILPTYIHVD